MALVYVNGELVAESEATVSVFDHGIVVGDGVFETILMHEGQAFALTRHLDRLVRSAEGLGLLGLRREEVAHAIELVIQSAEFARGRIRVTVTSGRGPLGSGRGDDPLTLIVAVGQADLENQPTPVATVPWTRNEGGPLVGLKTISYAENARALARAREQGATEAIFANTAGQLCEGTGSNVFYARDGALFTPPLESGCLAGTTRDLLLEQGIAKEADLGIEAFRPERIEEAFLASTVRGVQPIASIDSMAFSSVPGPLTSQALEVFNALLAGEIDP